MPQYLRTHMFMTLKNIIAGVWAIGRGSDPAATIECRKIMKVKRFIRFTTLCFQGAEHETIRKLTRNGVCVGPRTLSKLTIWLKTLGLANRRRRYHSFSQSNSLFCSEFRLPYNVLLTFMFLVCWDREAFPVLLHGGRTGGIVGNFQSGG